MVHLGCMIWDLIWVYVWFFGVSLRLHLCYVYIERETDIYVYIYIYILFIYIYIVLMYSACLTLRFIKFWFRVLGVIWRVVWMLFGASLSLFHGYSFRTMGLPFKRTQGPEDQTTKRPGDQGTRPSIMFPVILYSFQGPIFPGNLQVFPVIIPTC